MCITAEATLEGTLGAGALFHRPFCFHHNRNGTFKVNATSSHPFAVDRVSSVNMPLDSAQTSDSKPVPVVRVLNTLKGFSAEQVLIHSTIIPVFRTSTFLTGSTGCSTTHPLGTLFMQMVTLPQPKWSPRHATRSQQHSNNNQHAKVTSRAGT